MKYSDMELPEKIYLLVGYMPVVNSSREEIEKEFKIHQVKWPDKSCAIVSMYHDSVIDEYLPEDQIE